MAFGVSPRVKTMESYLLDWANLLLRWLHVITSIAWIGSSFYPRLSIRDLTV